MLKQIRILFVRDKNSCNTPYLLYCLYYLKKLFLIRFTEVSVHEYLEIDQSSYDVVVYATFPDENAPQFKKFAAVIPQTDQKFLEFKRLKLLFDSHDHGGEDGFVRLTEYSIPRLKTSPDKQFLEKFNVIFPLTYPIGMYPRFPTHHCIGRFPILSKQITKNIDISYRVNLEINDTYRYRIRQEIFDIIKQYQGTQSIDTQFNQKDINYHNYLARVLISICPPGHGPGTFRHLETLKAKSLMFSHESINNIQLLPNTTLIEGEDYISFNLDNMTTRLDELLATKENIQYIAQRGYQKFKKGYSVPRSGMSLYRTMIGLL